MEVITIEHDQNLCLRSNLDEVFFTQTDLENYFISKMIWFLQDASWGLSPFPDPESIEDMAEKFLLNHEGEWFIRGESKNTYTKIVLADFQNCEKTTRFFENLISRHKDEIESDATCTEGFDEEDEDSVSPSADDLYFLQRDEDEIIRNITG